MCSVVKWRGGSGGIEAYPYKDYYFLQCFDMLAGSFDP